MSGSACLSNRLITYSATPFLVTFPNGGAITSTSFSDTLRIRTGDNNGPFDVSAGDFDGDGKVDIALLKVGYYADSSGVFIYRNTGSPSSISFANPVWIQGDYQGMDIGDLDNDGKLDIVITGGGRLRNYLNTSTPGNISFVEGANSATGNYWTEFVTLVDADGDGKLDVVTNYWATSGLFLCRNISEPGAIAFAPKIQISSTWVPERNVLVGDLDGDGKQDLIVSGAGILKNNSTLGNISFTAIPLAAYTHSFICVGDIDGDGKADLVSGDNNGSKMAVMRNTTSGSSISFAPFVEFPCTAYPTGIAIADLDGDGKLDMVATLSNANICVFKNTSTPGLISFTPKIDYASGYYNGEHMVAIADINDDGKNDIIGVSETSRAMFIHKNTVLPEPFIASFTPTLGISGTVVTITGVNFINVSSVSFGGVPATTFTVVSPTAITAIVGTGATGNVAVTNTYGTGSKPGFGYGIPPTITSVSPTSGVVGSTVTISGTNFSSIPANNLVFFGSIKATVTSASPTSLSVIVPGGSTNEAISVTVNNLSAFSSALFTVKFPGSTGAFTANSFAPRVDRPGGSVGTMDDMDGDGKLDIVMGSSSGGLYIAKNTSTIAQISFTANQMFPTAVAGVSPATGDLDGDGKRDVVMCSTGPSISVIRNTTTSGVLSFQSVGSYLNGYAGASVSNPLIKDLDLDGRPEIAVINYDGRTISVFPNLSSPGNIIFAERIDYLMPGYPTGLSLNDVDGDGKPELIASVNSQGMVVLRNTSIPGSVSFGPVNLYTAGSWPNDVTVTDVDGDGKLDIATANINSNTLSIFRNLSTTGNISFSPKADFPTGDGPIQMSAGDLDGDGKPELNEANQYSGTNISILRNASSAGNISMNAPANYTMATSSYTTIVNDIDGDGIPDVSIASGGITSFLRNLIGAPVLLQVCTGTSSTITSNVTGSTYQWQQNTGSGFVIFLTMLIFRVRAP